MNLKLTLTITICALIGIISSHAFIPENEDIQTSEAQNIPYKLEANRNSKKNKSPKQISSKIQKLNVYKAIGDCLSSKFSASKAVDGNLSTCWAMNLDNAVVECDQYGGPTFYLNCKQLCYVIIHNGFSKTKALYNKNTRVKSLYIFLNNNEEDCIDVTLKDSSKPQRINIPQNETSKNITEIGISFPYEPAYTGSKWNDMCITEIEFWGIPY